MHGPGHYRMSGRRLALAAAAAAPLALASAMLAGCVREVADPVETDEGGGVERVPSTAVLTLGGARPGDRRADLARRLTEVPAELPMPAVARYRGVPGAAGGAGMAGASGASGTLVSVTFDAPDAEGRARVLFGESLEADGRPVLALGRSPKAVQSALGPGVRTVRRGPRGSGVISIGSVYAGEEWVFRRHDGEWRFFFDKERRLTGIEARALPAPPPAGSMPAIGG